MKTQTPPEVVLQLRADPAQFSGLRRIIGAHLRLWGRFPLASAAELCVTELLSNVHRHAGSPECELSLRLLADGVEVAVSDRSYVLPRVTGLPAWRSETGRGLSVVAGVADNWGTTPTASGKRVWAVLR
ncbi:ATP-binding protein [Streptomyces sp. XD-27]|uniref:ATP-binding protein n=1 Tax=Streptomyces sp. XD-27 TaxID=3062779 RepID=UPI0026F46D30|nr:ATP-binding protein [Streptomyces sp. XD-27]WKX71617.1 ATP-binding protein [Streptomyces sp. XD-27]